MDRAKLLVEELNKVCDYVSTLKQMIVSKDQKPDKKFVVDEKEAQDHTGDRIKLIDLKTQKVEIEA